MIIIHFNCIDHFSSGFSFFFFSFSSRSLLIFGDRWCFFYTCVDVTSDIHINIRCSVAASGILANSSLPHYPVQFIRTLPVSIPICLAGPDHIQPSSLFHFVRVCFRGPHFVQLPVFIFVANEVHGFCNKCISFIATPNLMPYLGYLIVWFWYAVISTWLNENDYCSFKRKYSLCASCWWWCCWWWWSLTIALYCIFSLPTMVQSLWLLIHFVWDSSILRCNTFVNTASSTETSISENKWRDKMKLVF